MDRRLGFLVTVIAASVGVGIVIWRPAIAQTAATVDSIIKCDSVNPCTRYINTGTGIGIVGRTQKFDGVRGEVANGDGIPFSLVAGVAGVDTGDKFHATNGVSGLSMNGNGGYFRTMKGLNALIAESRNFNLQTEGHSTVLIMGPNNTVPELLMFSQGQTTGFPFADYDDVNGEIFYFTSSGDLHLKGNIFTGGSCSTGCLPIRNAMGTALTTYTPRQPLPTIEDVGEAQLVAGEARVPLDPAFVATMDGRQPYLVFVTADGPNRGLYVSAKTRTGFEVRENPGGRSTLTFDYRIVAKPMDTSASSRFGAPLQDRLQAEPTIPKRQP